MCYGTGSEFANIRRLAAYETLERHLDDRFPDPIGRTVRRSLDGGASPAGACHLGECDHPSGTHRRAGRPDRRIVGSRTGPPPVASDGGRPSALYARRPALDDDFETLVEHTTYVCDQGGVLGDEAGVPDSRRTNGNQPRWEVSEGDRVLVVVNPIYDREVIEAAATAIREEGATVDVVHLNEAEEPREIHPWFDEFPGVTFPDEPIDERFSDLEAGMTPDERFGLGSTVSLWPWAPYPHREPAEVEWWQKAAEGYDLLLHGLGGPVPRSTYRYERFPWREVDNLAGGAPTFPRDVWTLIDTKTAALVERAESIRLTDPEGTDLTWTNYVANSRYAPSHVFAHPLIPTSEADTSGVLKGTINHASAFPAIEVEIEQGKAAAVHGGGVFGDLWRESLEVMSEYDAEYGELWNQSFDAWKEQADDEFDYDFYDADYDYYDGSPGLFWLWEAAIGTNPKALRPTRRPMDRNMFPLSARLRAGVMHIGLGSANGMQGVEQRAAEMGLPWGHVHVHLFFPTLEATMPDGHTETIIENGYLTTLDDPDVRSLAAEHGDPDEILSIDWVPPVPGISVDGDYDEYAADPLGWMIDHYGHT